MNSIGWIALIAGVAVVVVFSYIGRNDPGFRIAACAFFAILVIIYCLLFFHFRGYIYPFHHESPGFWNWGKRE
jgi:hypothetical protein